MKLALKCGLICCSIFITLALIPPAPLNIGAAPMVAYFKLQSTEFAGNTVALKKAIGEIKSNDSVSVQRARKALVKCRCSYKRIEFLLEYFFKSSALIYNSPAKYEIEEPEMAYIEPIGLQVIEALLFEENVTGNLPELKNQSEAISSSAGDLHSLLYNFEPNDQQILESLQIELIRVITLGLAGFDAPLLKSGINESYESLLSLQNVVQPYLAEKNQQSDSITHYLRVSLAFLKNNTDFDSFDRLSFITALAIPLRYHLNLFISNNNLKLNTTAVLNYEEANIFSKDALNLLAFTNGNSTVNNNLTDLGKQLFFEPSLSGNNLRSCATCHQPGKYFTDALPKSLALNNHSSVKRNAPALFYAGYQYAQFWDGRAQSLEEQVKMVINSPDEMNGNDKEIPALLQKNTKYISLFSLAFPASRGDAITVDNTAIAIAAFIRTLNPMNSAFDRYVKGDLSALTARQKDGFNLFMGKAQCGTCHFAPIFNGLMPPLYTLTELEVLGTPKTDNLDKAEIDSDAGRYAVFPIEFNERAFKTPTVRNAAVTAPYMHNGAFRNLENVVSFYNKGGGKGIGLPGANQTLSSQPLQLTDMEMDDIVSFLGALTDELPAVQ